MLKFDSDAKTLTLESPHGGIKDWRLVVEADGKRLESPQAEVENRETFPGGELRDLSLLFPQADLAWSLYVEKDDRGGVWVLTSCLENRSGRDIALGKVYPLQAPGAVPFSAHGDEVTVLPLTGSQGACPVYRLKDPECPTSSRIKLQLYNCSRRKAMQVGFLTFRRANTMVEFEPDGEGGLRAISAWCDFEGWTLRSGESTPIETFILAVGDNPHAQLEAWADRAAAACSPRRWDDPPIGWLGWAWVDAMNVETYEDVVLRNCAAIRRRLAGFPVKYVWVSIGNIAGGQPGDWLNWSDDSFPSGPAYLAARLRAMDFRWGLWCAMYWMSSHLTDTVEELREALLKDEDGQPLVVRAQWAYGDCGKLSKSERPCCYGLDASHPKTLAFLRKVFETYRQWGVRYYMLDFLAGGAGNIGPFPYAHHHDTHLVAGAEVYQQGLRAVREAAGDDTYLLACTGPTLHSAGPVDAVRTGNDFGEGRQISPESFFYPATYVLNNREHMTGPMKALRNQAAAYYTHRKLYLNDSGNVLTVDKPLPLRDAQVHATIHAMSGGPSMLGDDVDRMDEGRLALIKHTLPRSRDVAVPVDLFESPFPDHPKIFHRKVRMPWGTFDVVAVYNFNSEPLRQSLDLARLGLDAGAQYIAWEFWNGEYLGRVSGTLPVEVAPGSVCVYRLVEDRGRPVLMATDMHLLMGEMDVVECHWDPTERCLRGRAVRPRGERGSIFIHAPEGLCVSNPRGVWIAKDGRDQSLLIRVALDFDDGVADWHVGFAPV